MRIEWLLAMRRILVVIWCASISMTGCSWEPADCRDDAESFSEIGPGTDDFPNDDIDESPHPEEWGPHGVGFRRFEWTDPDRDNRRVPTIVYYPSTVSSPDTDRYENIKRDASLVDRLRQPAYVAMPDAPAVAGSFPLVVFSHGSGARNIQYKFLLEFLASHGYVVAAPNHVGNVGVLQYMPIGIDQTVERLFDVRFVIDRLQSVFADGAHPLDRVGDADRVALMGHSYGGNIALALAGTTYSWDYIEELCADIPADPYICPVAREREVLEPILPDSRVLAVVSIAHDGTQSYFGPDGVGAAGLAVPTLLIATDGDAFCPCDREAVPFFARLMTTSYLLHFFGGSHVAFTDVMNLGPTPLSTVHRVTRGVVNAFLDRHLKADANFDDDWSTEFERLNSGGDVFEWEGK